MYPEVFIPDTGCHDGLGGCGHWCREKYIRLSLCGKVNDFALQLNIRLTSKIDNVLAELVRPALWRPRERSGCARFLHRIHKSFPPEEHRRPNLARLVDIADTVFQPGAVPVFLVPDFSPSRNNCFSFSACSLAGYGWFPAVLRGPALRFQDRVQVDLIAPLLIAFNLAPRSICRQSRSISLKSFPLIFLHRELDQPARASGHRRHPAPAWGGFVPSRRFQLCSVVTFHPPWFSDPRNAKTLPVQIRALRRGSSSLKGKQMFFDVWRHNVLSFLPSSVNKPLSARSNAACNPDDYKRSPVA